MKHFCFTLYLLSLSFVYAQSNRIWILDSLTHSPVSDVLMRSQQGDFYSNDKGEIYVDTYFSDKILLVHFNYFQKFFNYTSSLDTIFITPKPKTLGEITVTNISHEPFDIGYYSIRKRFKNSTSLNDFITVATFIPSPKEDTYIDEILLSIKSKQYAEYYNVYLYQPDSTGKPGDILYKKNIIVDSLKKEGIINVRDLNIKIPANGILIGLENLKVNDSKYIGVRFDYTETIETRNSYITRKDPKINPNAIWVSLSGVSISNMTPCFGLKVYQK